MINFNSANRIAAACIAAAVLAPDCSFAAQEAKFIGASAEAGRHPALVATEVVRELAYTLLLQRKFPSWLYSIDQGATTMWERWGRSARSSA